MKKLFIITGTSKGLGFELATFALKLNHQVLGISRESKIRHPLYAHLKLDLKNAKNLNKKIEDYLKNNFNKKFSEVILINNAAMVEPINFAGKISEDNLKEHFQLNFFSPVAIINSVKKIYEKKSEKMIICNLSSGAATRPIPNWSAYCSSKAALKMYTDTLMEEAASDRHLLTFSFNPGVMDTGMQTTIRKQDAKKFVRVSDFIELKENKKLRPPKEVAEKLIDLINSSEKIKTTMISINDLN
jgi:benzil reductase ((S)-benzoin forming)